MNRAFQPIDISNAPDLIRLTEEVRAGGRPRVLQRDHKDVAIVMPVPVRHRRAQQEKIPPLDGLRASAGSWRGLVDADQLKRDIEAERGNPG